MAHLLISAKVVGLVVGGVAAESDVNGGAAAGEGWRWRRRGEGGGGDGRGGEGGAAAATVAAGEVAAAAAAARRRAATGVRMAWRTNEYWSRPQPLAQQSGDELGLGAQALASRRALGVGVRPGGHQAEARVLGREAVEGFVDAANRVVAVFAAVSQQRTPAV